MCGCSMMRSVPENGHTARVNNCECVFAACGISGEMSKRCLGYIMQNLKDTMIISHKSRSVKSDNNTIKNFSTKSKNFFLYDGHLSCGTGGIVWLISFHYSTISVLSTCFQYRLYVSRLPPLSASQWREPDPYGICPAVQGGRVTLSHRIPYSFNNFSR